MIENYKSADKYVTFKPTGEEYSLIGFRQGYGIIENDKKYLEYGFEATHEFSEQEYYVFLINSKEKLELVSDAYDLYYEAIYQGEKFDALFNPGDSIITLSSATYDMPVITGFVNCGKGEWQKDVDISEVEIIPIKEPIDLTQFLPSSNN